MIVLHIDTELGFRGGQRQVQLLMRGLNARGHEQLLVAPTESKLRAAMEAEGFATRGYDKPKLLGMRSPVLSSWLRGVVDPFHPDIVHAHSGNAHTLALSARGGRSWKLLTTRRVDFAIKKNWFSRRKYAAPNQRYIAISTGVGDVLIAGGVKPDLIDIVHSGVEVERVIGGDREKLRGEWLRGGEGPLIGFVGALVDHKAPWILAEAAPLIREQLPNAHVVFVGDGEERARISHIAAQHPGAITLAGWRDDIADCYAAFDLFTMPSKLEGLCTSLIDALAAGVPSIASSVGGIPDVIVDGETGVLIPAENPRALADAITALWRDPFHREKYIENGRAHVKKGFNAEAMVLGTESVYTSIQSGKSA
ncbi:glycosyltransferase [soil metagenome]